MDLYFGFSSVPLISIVRDHFQNMQQRHLFNRYYWAHTVFQGVKYTLINEADLPHIWAYGVHATFLILHVNGSNSFRDKVQCHGPPYKTFKMGLCLHLATNPSYSTLKLYKISQFSYPILFIFSDRVNFFLSFVPPNGIYCFCPSTSKQLFIFLPFYLNGDLLPYVSLICSNLDI